MKAPQLSTFLKDQLKKPSEDSKKWRATMLGLKGVAGMFLLGIGGIMFKPDASSAIATMVQFGISAWGGVIAMYLGAQGSVDFKTTAALQAVQKTESITEDINVTVTEKYDPVVGEKFANKYATDESYRPPGTLPDADAEVFR